MGVRNQVLYPGYFYAVRILSSDLQGIVSCCLLPELLEICFQKMSGKYQLFSAFPFSATKKAMMT